MASLRQALSFGADSGRRIPAVSPRPRKRKIDEFNEALLNGPTCCLEELEQDIDSWAIPCTIDEPTAQTHPSSTFQPEIYPNPFEALIAHEQLRNLESYATGLASIRGLETSRGRSPHRTHSAHFPYYPHLRSPHLPPEYSSVSPEDRTDEVYAIPARQLLIDERQSTTKCGRCLKPLNWGSKLPSRCQQPSCRAVNIGDDWAVNERFRQTELRCHDPHTRANGHDPSVNYLNQQIRFPDLLKRQEQGAFALDDPVKWDDFVHWDVFLPDPEETEVGFGDDDNDDLGFASGYQTSTTVSPPVSHGSQADRVPQDLSVLPAARLQFEPVDIPEWLFTIAKARSEAKAKAAARALARRHAEARVNPGKGAIAEPDTAANNNSSDVADPSLKAIQLGHESAMPDHAERHHQQQQNADSINSHAQIRHQTERAKRAEREKANMNAFLSGNRHRAQTTPIHPRPPPHTLPLPQRPTQPSIPTPAPPRPLTAATTATARPARPYPVLRINPHTGRAEFTHPELPPTFPSPTTTTAPNRGTEAQPSRAGQRLRAMSSLLADMNTGLARQHQLQQQLPQIPQIPRISHPDLPPYPHPHPHPALTQRERSATTIDLLPSSDATLVDTPTDNAHQLHRVSPAAATATTIGAEQNNRRERSMTLPIEGGGEGYHGEAGGERGMV